jgi:non-lysosomal glucosylceramidase
VSEADFTFLLPFSVEPESARPSGTGPGEPVANKEACHGQCAREASCQTWTFADGKCSMSSTGSPVPFNRYSPGTYSGVKGTWKSSTEGDSTCITLERAGSGPAQGTLSACATDDSSVGATVSASSAATIKSLWEAAFEGPRAAQSATLSATDPYGALTVHTKKFGPGEKRALTIVLSWHYPERSYLTQRVGNFYNNLFDNSIAAGRALAGSLESTVGAIESLHSVFLDASSLPTWLSDTLLNMLSHIRSAWWEENGKWRQWEAYDCVNVVRHVGRAGFVA